MDVKINQKEIKEVASNIQNIYSEYSKFLGDHNPFSKFSIGAGYYVWQLPDGEWKRLSDANAIEAAEVRKLMVARQGEVRSISDAKTAEKLFTVPSEEYVFYRLEGPEPRLMLAAWAFKWPARQKMRTGDKKNIVKPHPISIAFVFDGVRMPARSFFIRSSKGQWGAQVTNDKGVFNFPSLQAGKEVNLKDKETDREFDFIVSESQDYYEFDLTEYTDLLVSVKQDMMPVAGETVKITFRNKEYNGVTMPDGNVLFSFPLWEGKEIKAMVREESQIIYLKRNGNEITFNFKSEQPPIVPTVEAPPVEEPPIEDTPVEEPPVEYPPVEELPVEEPPVEDTPVEEPAELQINITVTRVDGSPMSNASLVFNQKNHPSHSVKLDKSGHTTLPPSLFEWGKEITTDITDGTRPTGPVKLILEEGEYDYLLHERENEYRKKFLWKQLLTLICLGGICVALWILLTGIFNSI